MFRMKLRRRMPRGASRGGCDGWECASAYTSLESLGVAGWNACWRRRGLSVRVLVRCPAHPADERHRCRACVRDLASRPRDCVQALGDGPGIVRCVAPGGHYGRRNASGDYRVALPAGTGGDFRWSCWLYRVSGFFLEAAGDIACSRFGPGRYPRRDGIRDLLAGERRSLHVHAASGGVCCDTRPWQSWRRNAGNDYRVALPAGTGGDFRRGGWFWPAGGFFLEAAGYIACPRRRDGGLAGGRRVR